MVHHWCGNLVVLQHAWISYMVKLGFQELVQYCSLLGLPAGAAKCLEFVHGETWISDFMCGEIWISGAGTPT